MGSQHRKSQNNFLGRGCCTPFKGGVQGHMGEGRRGGAVAGLTQEATIFYIM